MVLGSGLWTRQDPPTFSVQPPSGPPDVGAATQPLAGTTSEEGDASSLTASSQEPQEKRTITRKGVKKPSKEIESQEQLATWITSGDDTKSSYFWRKLQSSCSRHGDRSLPNPMIHNSKNGLAGVVRGVLIPFLALQGRWSTSLLTCLIRAISTNTSMPLGQQYPLSTTKSMGVMSTSY